MFATSTISAGLIRSRRRRGSVDVCAALVALLLGSVARPAYAWHIAGKVLCDTNMTMKIDAGDTPVGGVTVRATPQSGSPLSDETADDGTYRINVPSGAATYKVEPPGPGLPDGPGSVWVPSAGFYTIVLTDSFIQTDSADFLVDCPRSTTSTTSTTKPPTTSTTSTTTTSTTTTTACVPTPENTTELCSDMIDNDCDMLIDCQDPDCAGLVPCTPIRHDPSRISFQVAGGMDVFRSHGRVHVGTTIDATTAELKWLLSNDAGAIYRVTLDPGNLKGSTSGRYFSFRAATTTTGALAEPGPARVRFLQGSRGWVYYWITAYGDLSAATTPSMTLQFYIGDQAFMLHGLWRQTQRGWVLTRTQLEPFKP